VNNDVLLQETLKKCINIFKNVLNDIDSYIFQHNLDPMDIPKFKDLLEVIKQGTSIYIVIGSRKEENRWIPPRIDEENANDLCKTINEKNNSIKCDVIPVRDENGQLNTDKIKSSKRNLILVGGHTYNTFYDYIDYKLPLQY